MVRGLACCKVSSGWNSRSVARLPMTVTIPLGELVYQCRERYSSLNIQSANWNQINRHTCN